MHLLGLILAFSFAAFSFTPVVKGIGGIHTKLCNKGCLRDLIKEGVLLALPKIRSMVDDSVRKSVVCPNVTGQLTSSAGLSGHQIERIEEALLSAITSELQNSNALRWDNLMSTVKSEMALNVAAAADKLATNFSTFCNNVVADSNNVLSEMPPPNATIDALATISGGVEVLVAKLHEQSGWTALFSRLEHKIDVLGAKNATPEVTEVEGNRCPSCPSCDHSEDFETLKSSLLESAKSLCQDVNYTLIGSYCHNAAKSMLQESNLEGVCAPCERLDYGRIQKDTESLRSELTAAFKCPPPAPCPSPEPVDYSFIASTCLDISGRILNETKSNQVCPSCPECERINYDRISDAFLSESNLGRICPPNPEIPACPPPVCQAAICPEVPPCPKVVCTPIAKPVVMGDETIDLWKELIHGQYAPYVIFVQLGLILILSLILFILCCRKACRCACKSEKINCCNTNWFYPPLRGSDTTVDVESDKSCNPCARTGGDTRLGARKFNSFAGILRNVYANDFLAGHRTDRAMACLTSMLIYARRMTNVAILQRVYAERKGLFFPFDLPFHASFSTDHAMKSSITEMCERVNALDADDCDTLPKWSKSMPPLEEFSRQEHENEMDLAIVVGASLAQKANHTGDAASTQTELESFCSMMGSPYAEEARSQYSASLKSRSAPGPSQFHALPKDSKLPQPQGADLSKSAAALLNKPVLESNGSTEANKESRLHIALEYRGGSMRGNAVGDLLAGAGDKVSQGCMGSFCKK